MIDLHTHTLFSDGALILAEHIRQAEIAGYQFLGISDHADLANIAVVLPPALIAAHWENQLNFITVLAGVELTHVRPEHFAAATQAARKAGAHYVLAHGETICEPVRRGTNRAAIEAGVDILAHPGLITRADAELAAAHNVWLEISGKRGHSLSNGHVVKVAREVGAKVIFGSDAHAPEEMPRREYAEQIMLGAGMTPDEIATAFIQARAFAEHCREQAEADHHADW
jgi:histidinol phosphatase-like PHP family hydrolase